MCQQCGADHASPAGSSAASACQLPSSSPGGPRVELQVVLPYSLEAFTEAVQDTFEIAIAATASAGCECKIAKTDVDITRTTENAAPAGTRRRLHAASITVDVIILVPDAKTGSLLVQSHALSKEAMNDQLGVRTAGCQKTQCRALTTQHMLICNRLHAHAVPVRLFLRV